MEETRTCPYCGEAIRVEAVRCRYCRSRLTALDPERWHRDHADRRLAGVATAVARALAVPVGAVRVGFLVLAFFHLLGPILYGALWLVVPFRAGEDSPLTRGLARVRAVAAELARLLGGARSAERSAQDAGHGRADAARTEIPARRAP